MAADAPDDVALYRDPAYWDSRFETEDEFEWCKPWGEFRHVAAPALARARTLLVLGSGTSALPAHVAADTALPGLGFVLASDASPVAAARMGARARAQAGARQQEQL